MLHRLAFAALFWLYFASVLRCAEALPYATLVYKEVGGQKLHLYIDKPADWKAGDKRPAFVFFHGGGWNRGPAEPARAQTEYFARRGMVGIAVQYRLL